MSTAAHARTPRGRNAAVATGTALVELSIEDFAIIEQARLDLGPGLTVLTGETGAGKSIIVDALTAALGGRAGAEAVRTGARLARVEARFEVAPTAPAGQWLADQGHAGGEVVVARELGADGRSRAWINGRPATVGMLRDLGERLVEVIGQHESQRLLRPATHLDLLDAFAGAEVLALRAEVADRVARRSTLRAEQRALAEGARERSRRLELLRHRIAEIDGARLLPGEEVDLQARRVRLANADRLASATAAAYEAVYDADGTAAVDRIAQARAQLREAAALDPALAGWRDRLEGVGHELVELARELAAYHDRLEASPDELAAVEERLLVLADLRRKYGSTLDAVLQARDAAAAEVADLDRGDARAAEIGAELDALEADLAARCGRLRARRRQAAARLEAAVARELEALELERARLVVACSQTPAEDGLLVEGQRVAVGPAGADRVEFLLAANPGEAPRPLARIASGGELSRVMLALRHLLVEAEGAPVMVCDEVDAGIGERTAGAVGALLAAAARRRQVLCVTHLAQIASLADRHLWVAKQVVRDRTVVRVTPLEGAARVEEIARMLSGKMPMPVARDHAAALLGLARRKRGRERVERVVREDET